MIQFDIDQWQARAPGPANVDDWAIWARAPRRLENDHERMTRSSTVQVSEGIASREMQPASPTIFVEAVERTLA